MKNTDKTSEIHKNQVEKLKLQIENLSANKFCLEQTSSELLKQTVDLKTYNVLINQKYKKLEEENKKLKAEIEELKTERPVDDIAENEVEDATAV